MPGITELTQQVHAHHRAGDYRAALATADQLAAALAGAESEPGAGEAWTAVCRARREMGRFADAETAGLRALAALGATAGKAHPLYATGVRELARVYEDLGRQPQAEGLDRQALAIRRQALGDTHPETAQSLSDLSMVLEWLARYDESLTCAQEAAAIFARPEHARHPDRPQALTNLGFALLWSGNYKAGVAAGTEAHRLAEAIFPAGHPERATAALLLGRLLQGEFTTDRSEPLVSGALAARRVALGEEHPYCASALLALAAVRQIQRRPEDGEKLIRDALRVAEAAYGPDHTRVADACDRLAAVHAERMEYAEAEPLYRRAIDVYEKALGPNCSSALDAKFALADVLAQTGRAEDALDLCRDLIGRYPAGSMLALSDARQAHARVLGTLGHMTEAAAEAGAAVLLVRGLPAAAPSWLAYALASHSWYQLATGDVAAGVASAREAFELTLAGAGTAHPATIDSARALAAAYQQQGQPAEAERVLRRVMTNAPAKTPALDLRPDLAGALAMLGRDDEAERIHLQVVADRRRFGSEDPALADALLALGAFYEDGGNLGAAEPRYREALDIRRADEGPDGVGVARALHTLAALRYNAGLYPAALERYQEALEAYRRSVGEDSAEFAGCQHAIAQLYLDVGNTAEAERAIRAVIDKLARRGPRNAEYLGARQTLANVLAATGKVAEARDILLAVHADTCASLGATHPSALAVQSELAGVYLSEGDLLAAEPLIREVAEQHRVRFPDHPGLILDENRLAQVYTRFGEYDEARRHVDRYLALARQAGGSNTPGYAFGLLLLADVHLLRENYPDALKAVEEALDIRKRVFGNSNLLVAATHQRLAALELDMGKTREARSDAAEATAAVHRAVGPNHPEYARALRGEASVCAAAGAENAGDLLRRAVALERKCYGDNGVARVPGLVEWADWHFARKDYAPAEEALREAAGILRLAGSEENVGHATIASRLGAVMMRTDRRAEAGHYLRQAADIATRVLGPEHPDAVASARRVALWQISQGKRPEALATIEGALAGEDAWTEIAGDGVFAFDRYKSATDALLTDRLRIAFLAQVPGADVGPAYARLLRDRAREAALVAGPPLARVAPGPKLARLRRLRVQLVDATLAGPVFVKPEVHRERLTRWRDEERRAAAEFPAPTAVTPRQLADALPPNATLVEFVRVAEEFEQDDRSRYVAFVLPAGDASKLRLIDLGPAAPIDGRVGDWIASLARHGEMEDSRASALAEKLIAPLREHLGEGEDLFIVADARLRAVPFAALPIDNVRLVDRFAVTLFTSAHAILDRRPVAPSGNPVVVADPSGGGLFAWLRWMITGRRGAATDLADRLGVSARDATGNWLWDVTGRVVYLAMPGTLDTDPPFAPGKVATRFVEPPARYGVRWKSRRLSAAQTRELKLTPGAVVVMPETIPAETATGAEALAWMTRAFRHASASAAIFGLWSNPEWADNWGAFHDALAAGAAPAAALRQAQLRAKQQNASPSAWGGFVCVAG